MVNFDRKHRYRDGIAIRLSGGLGNQLFQYAAARATAERLQCELLIDTSLLNERPSGVTPREFALDQFAFKGRICTLPLPPKPLSLVMGSKHRRLAYLTQKLFHEFREDSNAYDPRFLEIQKGTVIRGYFQSPKYFSSIADELGADLQKLVNPTSWFTETKAQINSSKQSVAVHIRRGDYLSASARAYHGILPTAYYSPALAELASRSPVESIFVFSDEPDAQVLDGINWPVEPTLIHPSSDSKPMESLILMSQARMVVTANSSFSWWAGWLAHFCRRSMVFAPSPWFRRAGLDANDLIPPTWVEIPHSWQQWK